MIVVIRRSQDHGTRTHRAEKAGLRNMLAHALQAEGHVVTEVSDGVLAMAALWVARRPAVAVFDEHLTPLDAMDILELTADGEVPLARHRSSATATSYSQTYRLIRYAQCCETLFASGMHPCFPYHEK